MPRKLSDRLPRPLDPSTLDALAVHYLGRYATTRAKLRYYLVRKLRERGWSAETPPPVDAIVEKMASRGYVDDVAFAEARSGALARRGYGHRRVRQALTAAGIDTGISDALTPDPETAFAAAESFARRRHFGPFANGEVNPDLRRKHFAAMVRAGHDYDLARHFTEVRNDPEG